LGFTTSGGVGADVPIGTGRACPVTRSVLAKNCRYARFQPA
jgi:hypothetical protein